MTKEEAIAYELCVRHNLDNLTDEAWDIVEKALLKQVPKKYVNKYGSAYCPNCDNFLLEDTLLCNAPYDGDQFCGYCGQAIDWSK